jgi:hypothetical protein
MHAWAVDGANNVPLGVGVFSKWRDPSWHSTRGGRLGNEATESWNCGGRPRWDRGGPSHEALFLLLALVYTKGVFLGWLHLLAFALRPSFYPETFLPSSWSIPILSGPRCDIITSPRRLVTTFISSDGIEYYIINITIPKVSSKELWNSGARTRPSHKQTGCRCNPLLVEQSNNEIFNHWKTWKEMCEYFCIPQAHCSP